MSYLHCCSSCLTSRVSKNDTEWCVHCGNWMARSFSALKGVVTKRNAEDLAQLKGRFHKTIFGKEECDVCGTTQNLTIHHFVPTAKGGADVADNRMTLCRNCHDKVHFKPKKRGSVARTTKE